ncbi:unnamed protein product [Camellia sinensis]
MAFKRIKKANGLKEQKKSAKILGLGFIEGFWCLESWREFGKYEHEQVRCKEAPQGQEILVRLFPHCLGRCSSGAHDVVTEAGQVQAEIRNPRRKQRPK